MLQPEVILELAFLFQNLKSDTHQRLQRFWFLTGLWLSQVKSRAMELAKSIENEDGVAAAVDAFHRHLPDEIPMPSSLPEKDDGPDPLQWFFIQIGNWCCQRCGGV